MTLHMREIFLKPVDRSIDGVIKADDQTSLRMELEEYVITGEIAQRLDQFLNAYNNYTTANGVWISGFFGSGKSHLLKMLAYLLENHNIDGTPAYEIFKGKKELAENPMLAGALRKAVSVPSKSILFNIDQKADVISKTEADALLSVFQKVFDEMCGYYGKQPYIAHFERDLDSRGVLTAFKTAYAEVAGKNWERGREQALLEKSNIAKAYSKATGASETDAADILGHYRRDLRISIEDFAGSVKAWIDKQGPNFRLNFFVDEVGQYIADNTKLMTNLQTIAESLNTKCKGQAWIIVTAQQDMASVIGDMNARQQNDFSKIQARFGTRMPLNSADVAEVIQRRLLEKTPQGGELLSKVYAREENNLKTLFDFTDGSIRLKNYNGREQFIQSYPFPPYQYTLFQMAIRALSQHNAFEGKHSSVGERSMLGVFQEVAKRLADVPVGDIATFDLMFEGIRSALKSSVQQSIQLAEKNIEGLDPFAVRVLKALFLVKYVKEFKPTVRNIGILLLSEFDADQVDQKRKIEEALNLLERQTLIQRNGEVYEFLTNEEVDVQNEIKAQDVDPSEIGKELETLIFEETIRHKKIKYAATGHEYAFARKLDDRLLGRDYELAVNVISPLDENAGSPDAIRMRSMTREELIVLLPQDARFIKDLTLYKQTDKFIRQARTATPQEGRERIIHEKGEQNARRRSDLKGRLHKLTAEAKMFVRGEDVAPAGEDPQERVVKGFQVLIDKVYVNLPMLRGLTYTESDILPSLKGSESLFGGSGTGLTESEQEILNFAQSQGKLGVRVTVKALLDKFEAKPYGWPPAAVLCVAASLIGRNKLEARLDSTLLENAALEKAIRNSNQIANIVLSPQIEFQPSQIKALREFYKDFFDAPAEGSDAKALGATTAAAFDRLKEEVQGLLGQERRFPFLGVLTEFATQISAAVGKPATWYVTDLPKIEHKLIDAKERHLDAIRAFMAGPQRQIYEDVRRFLTVHDANFSLFGKAEADAMQAVLDDPACYKGSAIQTLKTRFDQFKAALDKEIQRERQAVAEEIASCRLKIEGLPEFSKLLAEQKSVILGKLKSVEQGLTETEVIAVLRQKASQLRDTVYPALLAEVESLSQVLVKPVPAKGGMEEEQAPPPKPIDYIPKNEIHVTFAKAYLSEEQDVESYVAELRKALMAEIRQGKRIVV